MVQSRPGHSEARAQLSASARRRPAEHDAEAKRQVCQVDEAAHRTLFSSTPPLHTSLTRPLLPSRTQKIIKQNDIWQGRFCSLLEGLLQWRAGDRISIDAALQHPFFEITINDEGRNSYRPQCPDLPPYVKEVVAARGR